MEKVKKYFMRIGLYNLNNGSTYEGEFFEDKIEGYGKFTWNDKKSYIGEWKDNCLHGFGEYVQNGRIFIGNFTFDRKEGIGMYILPAKKTLLGNFKNNEMENLSVILNTSNSDLQLEQICFMSRGKVSEVISDENVKNNIRISNEFRALMGFYEEHKDLIEKHQELISFKK
jgi:hypothetical protein